MENRPAMYNETVDYIAQEETAGRLLVIRPPQALPVDRVEKKPGAPEKLLTTSAVRRRKSAWLR